VENATDNKSVTALEESQNWFSCEQN